MVHPLAMPPCTPYLGAMTTYAAVFNTEAQERVSPWLPFSKASDLWTKNFDGSTHVVRSRQDPRYKDLPYRPAKMDHVKLDRVDREELLDLGRAAGDLESAKDAMLDRLLEDPRFEDIDIIEVSDYAWAAAKFCFPRKYNQEWR